VRTPNAAADTGVCVGRLTGNCCPKREGDAASHAAGADGWDPRSPRGCPEFLEVSRGRAAAALARDDPHSRPEQGS
jgi:hypothetical protein